jgi:hypothetical protein
MRPIEYRTDRDFRQALRCVEYRIAPLEELRPRGFILGLGLRYGLLGIAALHHLLELADPDEEGAVFEAAVNWSQVVTDHIRHYTAHRLPWDEDFDAPDRVGRLAQLPVSSAIPLLRRHAPLQVCLGVGTTDFIDSHRQDIRHGWGWFRSRQGERLFHDLAAGSQTFAMNFWERRKCDLEEVREIALLGE